MVGKKMLLCIIQDGVTIGSRDPGSGMEGVMEVAASVRA